MPKPEQIYSDHKKNAEGVDASQARLKKLYKENAVKNTENLKALKAESEDDYPIHEEHFERQFERNAREHEIEQEVQNLHKQNYGLADTVEFGKYAVEKDMDYYQQQAMKDAVAAGKKIVAPESGRFETAANVEVIPEEPQADK